MNQTLNVIIIFFLVMPLLVLSYQLGTPQNISEAKSSISEYLKNSSPKAHEGKIDPAPQKKQNFPEPTLEAISALAVDTNRNLILFSKNSDEIRPIASLTKMVTAAVVLDNAKINEVASISRRAIGNEGDSGGLKEGETLTIYNLLAAALLESSNDAAYALAEYIGTKIINSENIKAATVTPNRIFIKTMNQKFNSLNLTQSNFTDSSGLEDSNSFSTAKDFVEFIKYLRKNPAYAPIWEIAQLKKISATAENDIAKHEFTSTDPFLNEYANVIGGKTGYTNNALGNMLLVLKSPDEKSEIVYIVLGSRDRFGDTRKLVSWTNEAWVWPRNITK